MRVQFSYDQEEMVDASIRFLRRSKTIRSARWRAMIFINLLCWGLAYVVFILLLKNPYLAVMTIIVSTLLGFVMYPSLHEHEIRKRLRKLYKEQYGEQNSFT